MTDNYDDKIWWYLNNKTEKVGPVSYNKLKELYLREEITAFTQVWKNGLSEWRLLSELPELASLIANNPPPLHSSRNNANLPTGNNEINEYESIINIKPRPWIRFWAKMFDIFFAATLVGALFGLIEGLYGDFNLEGNPIYENDAAFGIIIMPFALILDALVLAIFGNTFGKAILNMKVQDSNNNNLNFSQSLRRNMAIYVRGLGFGLPIVNLFTMLSAYQTLTKYGICTWDKNQHLKVIQGEVGYIRGILFTLIFVISYTVVVSLDVLTRNISSNENNVSIDEVKPNTKEYLGLIWNNSITNNEVYFDDIWLIENLTEDSPETLLTLISKNDDVIIYLIHEYFNQDVTLPIYVEAIENIKKEPLGLVGFSDVAKDGFYSAYGKFDYDGNIMDSYVRVWSNDNKNFWHVVVITDTNPVTPKEDISEMILLLTSSTIKTIEF